MHIDFDYREIDTVFNECLWQREIVVTLLVQTLLISVPFFFGRVGLIGFSFRLVE